MSSAAAEGQLPLQGVPIKMYQYEICPFCNKVRFASAYVDAWMCLMGSSFAALCCYFGARQRASLMAAA